MAADLAKPRGPEGLSGWLVLVGIGLVIGPIRLLMFVSEIFPPIFEDGVWEYLTTPGSEGYHWLWAPLLILEIVGNVGFILAYLALLVLFLRKATVFPTAYITVVLTNIAFIITDALLGSVVLSDEPVFDPDTIRELSRSFVGAVIWVPYMLRSERVKNTFRDRVAA